MLSELPKRILKAFLSIFHLIYIQFVRQVPAKSGEYFMNEKIVPDALVIVQIVNFLPAVTV